MASDDETPPPDSAPPDSPPHSPPHDRSTGSSPPPPAKESRRRRLEGVIPEIVRRAVELGVEKATEAPDNVKAFVHDMKLPKEIAHYLLSQIDETKNGLFRVVAKEIRDFLERTNFAGEVQKLLTTVQFEVNTTIRFTPNDGADKKKKKNGGSEPPTKKNASSSSSSDEKSEEDAATTGDSGEHDDDKSDERRPTPLPRPEVKTNVHIRRDVR